MTIAKAILKAVILCGAVAVCVASGAAQVPAQSASATQAPRALSSGAFPAKVIKTLDSGKLKENDPIEVETAGSFKLADGTLVPKGSKLIGHVTAAKARSKGDPNSELTITFEKLAVTGGKQFSIKGTVQAVSPPEEQPEPLMAGKASGAAGGGYTSATVGTVTETKSGSNMDSDIKPEPAKDPKSVGVHGIHDLSLEDGVLRSTGKQVKLNGGDRMIVHADIFE